VSVALEALPAGKKFAARAQGRTAGASIVIPRAPHQVELEIDELGRAILVRFRADSNASKSGKDAPLGLSERTPIR
jgi:hypothetical protein